MLLSQTMLRQTPLQRRWKEPGQAFQATRARLTMLRLNQQGVARVERSVAERRVDQTPRFTKLKSLPQALMLTSRRVTTMVPTKTNCQPQALIQLNSSRARAT
jgi:hypothetical protein